jgi:hypothetical protein
MSSSLFLHSCFFVQELEVQSAYKKKNMDILALKENMAGNKRAMHTKLVKFASILFSSGCELHYTSIWTALEIGNELMLYEFPLFYFGKILDNCSSQLHISGLFWVN